jgi:hypothetical protein
MPDRRQRQQAETVRRSGSKPGPDGERDMVLENAVRHDQPCFELSEMRELRVSVVPRSVASKALDRNWDCFDYHLTRRCNIEPTAANLDPLMQLVEQITFRRLEAEDWSKRYRDVTCTIWTLSAGWPALFARRPGCGSSCCSLTTRKRKSVESL